MLERFFLYAKPVRASKWWPRDARGAVVWVGVLKDGVGWTLGNGDRLTRPQVQLARQLFSVGFTADGREKRRQFRTVMVQRGRAREARVAD